MKYIREGGEGALQVYQNQIPFIYIYTGAYTGGGVKGVIPSSELQPQMEKRYCTVKVPTQLSLLSVTILKT